MFFVNMSQEGFFESINQFSVPLVASLNIALYVVKLPIKKVISVY